MSDTKKKTNGDSASPSVSKGSKFAEKFNKLFSLCTELKNDAAGVMDYEKTIEENALLKSTLKKRDEELDSLKVEVQRLKQLKDSNLEDFGKKYGEYQTQLKDADDSKRALDAAQEKLQKANKDIKRLEAENKQLEKKARDTINARNTLGDELSEVVAKNTSLQTMLTAEQKKVRFYGEGKLTDKNPDELAAGFETFANRCHAAVMDCFRNCDAPPQNIQPLVTYIEKYNGRFGVRLPLTASTTVPLRLMRAAAAELVVMNAIVDHIFTDVYFPGAVSQQKAVSTTLKLLAAKSSRRESIVRCQLLAEFEIEDETSHSVAQAAFNEICPVLDSLLPAGEPRQRFQVKLAELLRDALELWQSVQTSKHRFFADFFVDAHMLAREDDMYADYDSVSNRGAATPGSPTSTGSHAVLLLFPIIYMGEEIICPAKALWSDQGAFVEAWNEANASSTTGAPDASRSAVPRRRNSLSVRMPQSPTASTLSSSTAMNGSSEISTSHLTPTRRSENGNKQTGRGR